MNHVVYRLDRRVAPDGKIVTARRPTTAIGNLSAKTAMIALLPGHDGQSTMPGITRVLQGLGDADRESVRRRRAEAPGVGDLLTAGATARSIPRHRVRVVRIGSAPAVHPHSSHAPAGLICWTGSQCPVRANGKSGASGRSPESRRARQARARKSDTLELEVRPLLKFRRWLSGCCRRGRVEGACVAAGRLRVQEGVS